MAETNEHTDPADALGGRLPLVRRADLDDERRELYDELEHRVVPWAERSGFGVKTDDGRFIGPFNAFLLSPKLSRAHMQMSYTEAKYTSLDKRTREVVILSVGHVWKSAFEMHAHTALARKLGLSAEAVESLVAGDPSGEFTAAERTAFRFTTQLCTDHRVAPDLYREAEETFGREGLVNMIYLIGNYLFTCALLNGFEIPVPAVS